MTHVLYINFEIGPPLNFLRHYVWVDDVNNWIQIGSFIFKFNYVPIHRSVFQEKICYFYKKKMYKNKRLNFCKKKNIFCFFYELFE